MFRTWPFIALRLIVYFGITVAYVLATGAGAGVGYGVGNIFADGGPEAMAFWGGIVGFGVVSLALYWIREYILYVVKAGHIAVMVHLIDGRDVPGRPGPDRLCAAGRDASASPKPTSCSSWTSW